MCETYTVLLGFLPLHDTKVNHPVFVCGCGVCVDVFVCICMHIFVFCLNSG